MTIADFVDAHLFGALATFAALYVAVVSLSLPVGNHPDHRRRVLVVRRHHRRSCGTPSAADPGALVFTLLIARSAIGDFLVRRAGPRLATLAEGFRDDAFHYLLFLRLVPLFPFFLVNLAPAIVGVRLPPFLAATSCSAFCR